MAIRAFEAIVKDGQIRLHGDVTLPEHTRVYVLIPDLEAVPQAHISSPRLTHREQAADFVKQIIETPADAGI